MSVKGTLKPGHSPLCSYKLQVVGLNTTLTPTRVSGFSSETDAVDLPDRTTASGGQSKATEFEVDIPTHHTKEIDAMEGLLAEGVQVSPTYKKGWLLSIYDIHGSLVRTWALMGTWCWGRTTPDLDMSNEGEMNVTTYKCKTDWPLASPM